MRTKQLESPTSVLPALVHDLLDGTLSDLRDRLTTGPGVGQSAV